MNSPAVGSRLVSFVNKVTVFAERREPSGAAQAEGSGRSSTIRVRHFIRERTLPGISFPEARRDSEKLYVSPRLHPEHIAFPLKNRLPSTWYVRNNRYDWCQRLWGLVRRS